jgi:putative copper export protein
MAAAGRWATFLALAVVLGTFGARWVVRAARSPRLAAIGQVAALVLIPAALVRLAAQVADMADPSEPTHDWAALFASVTNRTHWGHIWIIHVALAVAVAVAFGLARAGRRVGWVIAGAGTLALAITPALGGHAAEAERLRGLIVVADVLHVIGGGLWLGTLAVLAMGGLTRGSAMDLDDVIETVRRFSPLALTSAAVIAVSGSVAAWVHLDPLSSLWTTTYGRMLLIKLALVGLVLAAGAYNWRQLTPRLNARLASARPTFARAVATELSLGVLVFLVTAILVATPLPGME